MYGLCMNSSVKFLSRILRIEVPSRWPPVHSVTVIKSRLEGIVPDQRKLERRDIFLHEVEIAVLNPKVKILWVLFNNSSIG